MSMWDYVFDNEYIQRADINALKRKAAFTTNRLHSATRHADERIEALERTVGELALSPVGLSSMTKLAPDRLVGQMMGTWFMGAAIGNLVAGLATRFMPQTETVEEAMQNGVQLFGAVAAFAIVAAVVFFIFARPIKTLQAGIS